MGQVTLTKHCEACYQIAALEVDLGTVTTGSASGWLGFWSLYALALCFGRLVKKADAFCCHVLHHSITQVCKVPYKKENSKLTN